jgi:endonuclease/exonuclease/phosphatase family metal-dependent hydrolase
MSNAMLTDVAAGACHPAPVAGAPDPWLHWFEPARSGDEATLQAWCATVGPPVYEPLPAAALVRESRIRVTLASWNTHGGSGDLVRFIDEQLGLRCTETGPLPAGSDFQPFVLLIQEAFRASDRVPAVEPGPTVPNRLVETPHAGPRLDIIDVARWCGLALLYVPSMRNGYQEVDGLREDRGNAILSTLPLTDPIAIELPFEAQRRVTVGATVHVPVGAHALPAPDSVRVVSLHLDTSSSLLRTLGTGNSTRLRQGLGAVEALALAERTGDVRILAAGESPQDPPQLSPETEDCDEARAEPHPIATILAGDLNTWSDGQTVIQHLMCYFPESPPLDGQSTRGVFPADHMFFRAGGSGRVGFEPGSYALVADSYNSDHRARVGILIVQ